MEQAERHGYGWLSPERRTEVVVLSGLEDEGYDELMDRFRALDPSQREAIDKAAALGVPNRSVYDTYGTHDRHVALELSRVTVLQELDALRLAEDSQGDVA